MREPTRDSQVALRLSGAQKQVVVRAATIANLCVSDYIRGVLLPAARDVVAYHAVKNSMGDAT